MKDLVLARMSIFVHRKDASDRIGPNRCEVCGCIPRTQHTELFAERSGGTWHRLPVRVCGSAYCKLRAVDVLIAELKRDARARDERSYDRQVMQLFLVERRP